MFAFVFLVSCKRADAPIGPCPAGSKPVGAAPPEGSQLSCVLVSQPSVKHGPYSEWWPGEMPPKKKREGAFANGKLDGKWVTWYESGRPQREVTYVAGVLQGTHVERYDDATGGVKETGQYKDGQRVGVWNLFHPTGTKERDLEHMPDGEQRWTVFSASGNKIMSGAFVEQTKHGLFTEFHANGKKASEGMWKSSKKDGKWTYWNVDGGEVATEEYREGKVVATTGVVPERALPAGVEPPTTVPASQ